MHRIIDVAENLGDKLAVILPQFPHTFTADEYPVLIRFLDHFARSPRMAVEFRHEGWWRQHIAAELRGRRIAWVAADRARQREAAYSPTQKTFARRGLRSIISTADFLYVRWLGRHGQFLDRRQEHFDPTPRLEWWGDRLRNVLNSYSNVQRVYAFFDNDFSGHSPTTANRFAEIVGLPRWIPPAALIQPMLFAD